MKKIVTDFFIYLFFFLFICFSLILDLQPVKSILFFNILSLTVIFFIIFLIRRNKKQRRLKNHINIAKNLTTEKIKKHEEKLSENFDFKFIEDIRKEICPPHYNLIAENRISLVNDYLKLKKDHTLLDMGCQDGKILLHFVENAAFSYGIDISKNYLYLAKKRFLQNETCFNGCQADITKLPFKSEAFDRIIFLDVIEHTPDTSSCVKEAQRVLKPNGRILITTDCAVATEATLNPFEYIEKLVAQFVPKILGNRVLVSDHGASNHNVDERLVIENNSYIFHRDFTPVELKEILHKSGLEVRDVLTYNYHLIDGIVRLLARLFPNLKIAYKLNSFLTKILSVFPVIKYIGSSILIVGEKTGR